MQPYRSLLLAALVLPAAFLPAPSAAQNDSPASRFAGSWTVSDSGGASRGRDRAVESATDDMNFIARPIARRRLKQGTPIHRSIRISGEGADFRAQVGGYDLDFAADGSRHRITDPFDQELNARQRFRNGRLVQTMTTDDATLTHTLALSADGQQLTLTVKIESEHLPGDVVFRIRYRKS